MNKSSKQIIFKVISIIPAAMLRTRHWIFGLLMIGVLLSCSEPQKTDSNSTVQEVSHPDMDWIIGHWVGGVDDAGLLSEEVWTKVSKDRYAGEGESSHEGEVVSSEHMEISTQDGHHCLIVDHGGSEPITFDFVSEDANGFICRNNDNDFPKQIEYRRDGDELIAIISDGAPTMEFRFVLK